jgi:hypothetical protein
MRINDDFPGAADDFAAAKPREKAARTARARAARREKDLVFMTERS